MKPKIATAWLGGCSGCHMSFLDMDERLIELAEKIELVYSPIADIKEYPEGVDIALVEGAVTNSENEHEALLIRANTKFVIAFGDCATTGNVTAMRNKFPVEEVEERAYVQLADEQPGIPSEYTTIARMLKHARPLHEIITVDAWLHGCPPTADEIWFTINELLQGRKPVLPPQFLRYG
jgi:NAD-reducing hydrogenase small subunit